MICFHFTIFVVLETTRYAATACSQVLWFAFILLSLSYWKQLCRFFYGGICVVICFHFTIFVVLETTVPLQSFGDQLLWFAFILLSLSYWKQRNLNNNFMATVVICFHFTIFVVLETTTRNMHALDSLLWFAFILLSLSYWKQRLIITNHVVPSCDLLSFYYLCRTGNNMVRSDNRVASVVICFHFTIFVVLETTGDVGERSEAGLWFAFILLSLSYWKQLLGTPHG